LTSFDAVRHACGYAVWRALESIVVNRELMRDWVERGLIGAEWGPWLEGER
jgi:hypothetical protein